MDGDVIEAGRVFLVSSISRRESHDNLALFRAKAPLAVPELRARYLAAHPVEAEEYTFEPRRFVTWLARSGLVEEVPFTELFLGAYGEFRPELKARGGVAGAARELADRVRLGAAEP